MNLFLRLWASFSGCEPLSRKQVVALFAKYAIPKGSELTFDYDMEFSGAEVRHSLFCRERINILEIVQV